MGILRTNTVSGIETPTPVTGSVVFDGSGDYLSIPISGDFVHGVGDLTIEAWIYTNSSSAQTVYDIRDFPSYGSSSISFEFNSSQVLQFYSGNYSGITPVIQGGTIPLNTWTHLAFSRSSGTNRLFINGFQVASNSTVWNQTGTPLQNSVGYSNYSSERYFNGYISNIRILKGTALYTSNFTPPTRELQPIGDTVLLCCNNPDSAGAEATGKTITVNGNATASTFSPGLVRDFTYGTQFDGVSKFDTQGYFVPPSGNTQNRYTLGLDEIVTSGLVLHLDAGNPFSYPATGVGTTWTDLSINANNVTLSNGISYTDNNRGVLVFDGVNDYVDFFAEGLTSVATVEMWANNVIPARMFFGWNLYNVYGWNSRLGYNTANSDLYGISAAECTRLNVFNSNIWNHYVFEMRSDVSYTNNKIYINGISQPLSQLEGTESGKSFNSGYGRISSWKFDLVYPIKMNCPVFKVYNKALTAAEVQQNYEALKGRYGHS